MIQSRYGWTDDQVWNLPYARFFEIIETIAEQKKLEYEEQMTNSAFIGWQYVSTQQEKPLSFGKYLKKLGIQKQKVDTKKESQRIIEKVEKALGRR